MRMEERSLHLRNLVQLMKGEPHKQANSLPSCQCRTLSILHHLGYVLEGDQQQGSLAI